MNISKQDAMKYGVTFTLLVLAVSLTMVFSGGTVETGIQSGTLNCYYDDGINQYSYKYNFSFELISGTSYPEITTTIQLDTDLVLWIKYTPKVKIGYNQQMFIEASLTDIENVTVSPVPVIGNFSLDIVGESKKGLDLTLPALELKDDYRNQKWVVFKLRLPFNTNIVLSLLFVVGILWVMEAIPLVATSLLIPIYGVVFLGLSTKGLFAPFAEPVIFLFLGGFIISKALNKTGLDKWISLNIVRVSPDNPKVLMLLMMVVTAVLSMFMSNTATAATMIPIAVAVTDKMKVNVEKSNDAEIDRYGKALVLAIAYSASLGGIGSAIGTPANPIAIKLLSDYAGVDISFAQWFIFGLPLVILMLPAIWMYLWFVFKPKVPEGSLHEAKIAVRKELDNIGPLNRKQIYVFSVFILALVLWFLEGTIKRFLFPTFSSSVVAVLAAVLLFVPGLLQDRDVNDLNWNAILVFGGGLVLGVILTESGTGDVIAFSLERLNIASKIAFIAMIAVVAILLTFIASNTGSASILIPLVIPLGLLLRIDPVLLAVVAAIGSSVDFMLPQGTPPTMIAYSTEKYTVKEMAKIGSLVDIVGLALLAFVLPFFWRLIGLVYF